MTRIFRWVTDASRPGWLVLLAQGWVIESIDERYGSILMSREEMTCEP